MVKLKSVPLPLPLKRSGIPDTRVLAWYIRSFGGCPDFCWYQYMHGPELEPELQLEGEWLVWQERVTVDPGADVTAGGWVTVTWPLHPAEKRTDCWSADTNKKKGSGSCWRAAEWMNLWDSSRAASRWGWWWESWCFLLCWLTHVSGAVLNCQDYKPSQLTGGSADDAKPPLYGNDSSAVDTLKPPWDTKSADTLLGLKTSIKFRD